MEKKSVKKSVKKKKIAAARLASILATRCTGNRIFLWTALGLQLSNEQMLFFFRPYICENKVSLT